MNEFNDRRKFVMVVAPIAICIRNQQQENRADAFATGADNVFGNLIDERDFRMKLLSDYKIYSIEICSN